MTTDKLKHLRELAQKAGTPVEDGCEDARRFGALVAACEPHTILELCDAAERLEAVEYALSFERGEHNADHG